MSPTQDTQSGNRKDTTRESEQEQAWKDSIGRKMKEKFGTCNFLQINLHHSKLASAELTVRLQKETTFVAMVQEGSNSDQQGARSMAGPSIDKQGHGNGLHKIWNVAAIHGIRLHGWKHGQDRPTGTRTYYLMQK